MTDSFTLKRAALVEAMARRDELRERYEGAALEAARALLDLRDEAPAAVIATELGLSRSRIYQLLKRAELEIEADLRDRAAFERQGREDAAHSLRGLSRGSSNCFECGRFKSNPASVCEHCGDDPVSHAGDPHEFNRAYGYAS